MIIAIRTDKPESELYLLDAAGAIKKEYKWLADRKLADTIIPNLRELIKNQNLNWQQITGVIVFTGQGSFTGLRIGTTVANALSYSLNIPVVKSAGSNWQELGTQRLTTKHPQKYIVPDYASAPNITKPKLTKGQK